MTAGDYENPLGLVELGVEGILRRALTVTS